MNQQGEGPKNMTRLQKDIIGWLGSQDQGAPMCLSCSGWSGDDVLRWSLPQKRQNPLVLNSFQTLVVVLDFELCLKEKGEPPNPCHNLCIVKSASFLHHFPSDPETSTLVGSILLFRA